MNTEKILASLDTITMTEAQRSRAASFVRASALVVEMLFGMAQYVGLGSRRAR